MAALATQRLGGRSDMSGARRIRLRCEWPIGHSRCGSRSSWTLYSPPMPDALEARPATAPEILPLRTRLGDEVRGQIVHDSLHRRPGWTASFLLQVGGAAEGFGSVA